MNILSVVTCSVFILSASVSINAQSSDSRSESEARTILDEMSAKISSYSTIEISFTADYVSKRTGDKHASKGTLKMKGQSYVLDVNDMVTYSDGKTVSVWQKNNNEVDITNYDPDSEDDMTPSKLFGAYKSGYKLRRLPDKLIGDDYCQIIDLYPIEKQTNIMRIRISVSKSTRRISQFEQSTKSGETLTVNINNYKVNQAMPDNTFVFDAQKHKGIEIVDLR